MLLSIVAPFAAFADSFYVNPTDLTQGSTGTLQFILDNTQELYGFQADVKLPAGVTALKNGNNLDITLSSRAEGGDFNVTSNSLPDGTLKIGALSSTHKSFSGNNGVLVNMNVSVAENFAGGIIEISNIIFADSQDKDVPFSSTSAKLGVAVTEVTFTRTTLTLTEGENTTFVATIHPDEATDKNVTWASSDPSVASVTDKGYVEALKAGSTNITATSANGVKATCVLTVKAKVVAVTGISLNKTALNLTEGDSETLTATITPENATNKNMTWSSDHEEVATVSQNGVVTAVGEGTANITVSSANGKEATCKVTVAKKVIPVTSINLSQTTAELKVKGTVTLTATVLPANTTESKTVTWKSSAETIATVDANGKVTANAIGEATITATCGTITATCKVTVVPTPVESVAFTRKALTIAEAEEITLTPNFTPATATDKSVTWKSSDESVATVSNKGVVKGIKAGTANITATSTNGKVATCVVTVSSNTIAVTSISISKTELNLTEGDKATLTATVAPNDATDKSVEWTSDDTSVAIVSENGEVTAVAPGTAIITAESSNGKSAKCTVTVAAKIIEASSIKLSNTTAELKVNETITLTATVNPENTTDKTLTWKSSDEATATVDADGKVTAKAIGEATITVSCGKATASCKVTVIATPVESIKLNLTELNLTEGEKASLKVTFTPGSATDKSLTWSSSDNSVATVSAAGEVTAVKAGKATITATSANGKTATCVVTVEAKDIPVVSVSLDKTELKLTEGDKATLTATITPADATDHDLDWTSSNPKVASVSDNGEVTALKAGTATITVATHNGKSATCTVSVAAKIINASAITLSKTEASLKVGESIDLTATVAPENTTDKTITWKSSNENVASVDAKGKVTAKAIGEATITATCGSVSATCKVTVIPTPVESIVLSKTELSLTEGEKATLTATVAPEDATDKSVAWTSSDTSVATVSASGEVTAVKAGTAKITATSGGKTATCTVTVKAKTIAATGVTLSKTTAELKVGETLTLTATVAPENATDKTIVWASSDEKIATVDANGKVTAIALGEATISATCGKVKASCKVTVIATPVETITISQTAAEMKTGDALTLTATIAPAGATDKTIVWASSNEKVATVDQNGKVTAVGAGEASITAVSKANPTVKASCKVTVKDPVVPVTGITLDKTSAELETGETLQLTATVAPANATDKTVTWKSSDETIATVDQNGLVKAVGIGEATITASAGDQTAECALTVKSGTVGVEIVGFDSTAPIKVYDLNGRYIADKVENLEGGFYIIRQGSNVKKIRIK